MKKKKIKLNKCHESIMTDYCRHLKEVAGFTVKTIKLHDYHMRAFLDWLVKHGINDVEAIEPPHILKYLKSAAKKFKPGTMSGASSTIRGFALYLRIKGIGNSKLADSIPRMKVFRLKNIPNYLTKEQEEKYLWSFDRNSPAMKAKALEHLQEPKYRGKKYRPSDSVLAFLEQL